MGTVNNYTYGIVLDDMAFGESSKIIKVFTRNMGKISIMVKGAMSSRSKNLSVTQVFGVNEYLLKKGQSFYYIAESKIIESNFDIRNSYWNLIYASLLSELLDKSTIDEHSNSKVFDLFRKTLNLYNSTNDPIGLAIAFELKYLTFIGYKPNLEISDEIYFSIKEGVIDFQNAFSYKLTKDDLKYFNALLFSKLENIEDIIIDNDRKKFLHKIIIDYIKYNLEISSFKSNKLFS